MVADRRWLRAQEPDDEADERPDDPIGGFQVRLMSELPTRMLERILRRRFDPNPDRVTSDYDELRWG